MGSLTEEKLKTRRGEEELFTGEDRNEKSECVRVRRVSRGTGRCSAQADIYDRRVQTITFKSS